MSQLQDMWNLMREHHFDVSDDSSSAVRCTICKNILIEACDAPCGCCFCKSCIKQHLKEGKLKCPGQSEYCGDDLLVIDENIHTSPVTNRRVSRLLVECPNAGCHATEELRTMRGHMRVCDKQPRACPYVDIGCDEDRLDEDQMEDHIATEAYSHIKLVLKQINEYRNEVNSLKRKVEDLETENEEYRKKAKIDGGQREAAETKSVKIDGGQREAAETKSIKTGSVETILGEIHWKINNWTQNLSNARKGGLTIISEPFLTDKNGFRICLYVMPALDFDLSVGFFIMRGPYDDELRWPFGHHVELSVMNHSTKRVHKSKMEKCSQFPKSAAFQKPTGERNTSGGGSSLIKLKELSTNRGLTLNNQLWIKCAVIPARITSV